MAISSSIPPPVTARNEVTWQSHSLPPTLSFFIFVFLFIFLFVFFFLSLNLSLRTCQRQVRQSHSFILAFFVFAFLLNTIDQRISCNFTFYYSPPFVIARGEATWQPHTLLPTSYVFAFLSLSLRASLSLRGNHILCSPHLLSLSLYFH